MPSSSVLVSFAESTGVLPGLTMCFGPRTELAGLNGRTWCSRRDGTHDSRLYPKRRARGESRSRRLCMCVTRSAFVIKPDAGEIEVQRLWAV